MIAAIIAVVIATAFFLFNWIGEALFMYMLAMFLLSRDKDNTKHA